MDRELFTKVVPWFRSKLNAETQIGVIARTIWIVLGSPSEVTLIELVEVSPQLLGFGLG
jgi:hypothetical protein